MSAVAKKLVSLVQSGPLLRPHYVVNFCQTKSTEFGGWVEGGGPGNDVPGDVVGDIHVFQSPDMVTQLDFIPLIWIKIFRSKKNFVKEKSFLVPKFF